MTAEFHKRVREIFDRALELPEEARMPFVTTECGADGALFQQVKRLLQASYASASFLDSAPVQKIGRFMIHGELGRGGMGIVYDAVDPVIGRSVALKVINIESVQAPHQAELMRERLFREARSSGQLSHPGIVVIYDAGQQDESAFIAMERVEGRSLQRILAGGPAVQPAEALRILSETAAALDYAHRLGIVHRDIKPGNIMVRHDGAVKLTDFGIAKVMSGAPTTMTGIVMGTPSYMSPEQIGGLPVDGRADQFSLAVVAYELFAGFRPFLADSIPSVAHLIVYGERPSPRKINPSLPIAVDWVFYRALARAPEDRFPTCSEFANALKKALESAIAPAPQTAAQETTPAAPGASTRGKRLAAFALAGAIMILALGLGYAFRRNLWPGGGHPAPVPPQPAAKSGGPQASMMSKVVAPSVPAPPAAAAPPAIHHFRVEPASIKSGDPATLTWDVAGADVVVIDHGIGKARARDTSLIVPTSSTAYALTATNSAGTSHYTAFVEVQPQAIPPAVHAKQLLEDALEERKGGHPEAAIELLNKAADLGNVSAMLELGEAYRAGEGAAEDDKKAMSWFRRAADSGNTSGMVLLGVMYLFGVNGTDANEGEASQWFQRAADKGDPAGLYNLAMSYEKGRGVGKNLDKARDLYSRAAQLGNGEARKRLDQLPLRK